MKINKKNVKIKKLLLELPAQLHKDLKLYCVQNEITIKEYFYEQVKKTVYTNK